MTGHNHHPDCPCGWCVYGDRDHGVHKGITFGEAKLLLKNHGVTSRTSCFVIPNARCPVCQASVYYYANDLGSRVFFDHLGPPWPKHGCTDNPRIPMPSASPPKLRELALAERLLMSAQLLRESVENSHSYSSRGWKVLQVVQRSLIGQNCTIKTRHVNSKEGGPIPFNYASPVADFEIGDLLYLKGEEVEYLDKKTLQPRELRIKLNPA